MLKFVRGDTCLFKVKLITNGEGIIARKDIDTIFITCRQETTKDSNTLFIKTMEDMVLDADGYLHCKFDPSDTENLYYGTYYFDIEITLKSGYRKSKLYQFELTQETTMHGGTNGV